MKTILEYLERQVAAFPQKTAFADLDHSVAFAQLQKQAQAVGTGLSALIAPRSPVVFYGEKSALLLSGFLGTVYAGGFYVLIDPKQPALRAKAILDTLHAACVVAEEKYYAKACEVGFDCEVLQLQTLLQTQADPELLSKIRRQALDIDPLYAIFTSGSTGAPKGVVVSHRSVIDFIDTFVATFGISHCDVIANQAPFDFDVSVKDIYSGLATGACVHLIPREFFMLPAKLMDFLEERKATVLIWAVSALCFVTTMKGLEYKVPKSLSKIMFSGEVMPVKHLKLWKQFLPEAMYVNLYGPTEITCNCMYYIVDRDFADDSVLPLGVCFDNEKVFLLDENHQLVTEPDILGEICVSGTALALGYFGNRTRTESAFLQNPLNPYYNEQIYCTGDLARFDHQGDLYYVTRKDFQIKHMGHRIELGEIETVVNGLDGISRVCCLYLEQKQKILAFYTGTAEKRAIVAALRGLLPAYMLPSAFIKLEQMPITKNGKIDRKFLQEEYEKGRETNR